MPKNPARNRVCPAWVDPNRLEPAILKLALNARDAMPSGGKLSITCKNRRTEAGNAPPNLVAGDDVGSDRLGHPHRNQWGEVGVPPLSPFSTTKEAGHGSGGLSDAGQKLAE